MRIFHITTTDLLLGFSDGEVPKVDGLYIGLTQPEPLLRHFHELFSESQKSKESRKKLHPRPGRGCKILQPKHSEEAKLLEWDWSLGRLALSDGWGEAHAPQSFFIGYRFAGADVRFQAQFRQARASEFTIKGRQVSTFKCVPAPHHLR